VGYDFLDIADMGAMRNDGDFADMVIADESIYRIFKDCAPAYFKQLLGTVGTKTVAYATCKQYGNNFHFSKKD
jgi:hypothetical protein